MISSFPFFFLSFAILNSKFFDILKQVLLSLPCISSNKYKWSEITNYAYMSRSYLKLYYRSLLFCRRIWVEEKSSPHPLLISFKVPVSSWEPPIYYYYYLNFFLCIHLYQRETFLFYLSFLLSFIIFLFIMFYFLCWKEENKTLEQSRKMYRHQHQKEKP